MKVALLWTMLLVPFIACPAGAVDITACGQLVPDGQIGVLQVDLDCGGAFNTCFADPALACAKDPACTDTGCGGLMLRNGATLEMNGHTVANGIVLCPYGVSRNCSVVGPGIIAGGYGLFAQINLSASGGLDVHGGQSGIVALKGKAFLQDVTVSGVSNNYGIVVYRRLRLVNVTSNNNQVGVFAYNGPVIGSGLTTNNNHGAGVQSYGRLNVTGLMATGNGEDTEYTGGGVVDQVGSVRLENSVVTGNFSGSSFSQLKPLDVYTKKRPRLIDTTCDHSGIFIYQGTNLVPWGVCSQD